MQSIETALESRKGSWTDFEAFNYILAARLGDFHIEMNATIKNMQSLMPSESSEDQLTLSYFAQKLVVNHLISNQPSKIKQAEDNSSIQHI